MTVPPRSVARATLRRLAFALVASSLAAAQESRRVDLQQVEKVIAPLRLAQGIGKTAQARYDACLKYRTVIGTVARDLQDSDVRTPEDAFVAGRILLDAERPKDAARHLLRAIEGRAQAQIGLPPKDPRGAESKKSSKPAPKPVPKPTPKPAPKGSPRSGGGQIGGRDLPDLDQTNREFDRLMKHFDDLGLSTACQVALRSDLDETTLLALLDGIDKLPVLGSFHLAGAITMPTMLMKLRGVPQERLDAIARRYRGRLDEAGRQQFDAETGLIGRKPDLPASVRMLGVPEPQPLPDFVGRVVVLHFFEATGFFDDSVDRLVRFLAAKPDRDVVVVTFVPLCGLVFDGPRGIVPERDAPPLAEEEEVRLLSQYRATHGAGWPWAVAGRWKPREHRTMRDEEAKPELFRTLNATPPSVLVVDRAGLIRYRHAHWGNFAMLAEAVDLVVAEGR